MKPEDAESVKQIIRMWTDKLVTGTCDKATFELMVSGYCIGLVDRYKTQCELVNIEIQQWLDKQGHERCWYYPEIFNRIAELSGVTQQLPSALPKREEFEMDCKRYQLEEYESVKREPFKTCDQ